MSFNKKSIVAMMTFSLMNNIHVADIPTDHLKRVSSYPYISGDTFRAICNHHIDETNQPFDPHAVQTGDIIFVRGYPEFLDQFLHHLPHITNKFILLTHNMDETMPGKYEYLLNDERIIAWFTQNKGINHPKLIGLPIGIANAYIEHGNTEVLNKILKEISNNTKQYLLYVNFRTHTNMKARNKVLEYFKTKPFCTVATPKPWSTYLIDMSYSKFILSPPGNGFDCHRAWEALLMNSIPVMISTPIDDLFDDLPVIIVKNWSQVTKEFLEQQYSKIKQKNYNFKKLYADYWLNKIKIVQANAKKEQYL